MKLLNRLNISTKVFLGYRALARQTVADGQVQANMLMTRLLRKDFVITASWDNIDAVKARAEKTVEMIGEARGLTENPGYLLPIESLDRELQDYLSQFECMTARQAERDEIVHGTLNVVGPRMEKNLRR